jgi:ABC-type dipeptide/oligopeptide/nickel transport system ATPase component
VLYRGVVVEEGPLDEIVRSPKSEHARALVASYSLGSPALLGNARA